MNPRPWPVRLAITEGIANALSGRAVSLALVVATAWLCAGVALANALDVDSLERAEQEWIAAGGYAFVVQPSAQSGEGDLLDPQACERLNAIDGVGAAFAVRRTTDTLAPAHAAATDSTVFLASPSVYRFLRLPAPSGTGVIVTEDAAAATGIGPQETTQWTVRSLDAGRSGETFMATSAVTHSPMLAGYLKGAYLVPSTFSDGADACYVRTDAAHSRAVADLLPAVLATTSGQALANPRLSDNTYGLDFATAYGDRIMRWSPFAGAAVLAAMWAIVQWTRRVRMAVYATFGANAGARMSIQFTEWVALSGLGAVYGWATGLAFAIGCGVGATTALTEVTGVVAIMWAGASVAALVIGRIPVGTLLDALKDRS